MKKLEETDSACDLKEIYIQNAFKIRQVSYVINYTTVRYKDICVCLFTQSMINKQR